MQLRLHFMPILQREGVIALLLVSTFPLLGLFLPIDLWTEIALTGLGLSTLLGIVLMERMEVKRFVHRSGISLHVPSILQSGVPSEIRMNIRTPWKESKIDARLSPSERLRCEPDQLLLQMVATESQHRQTIQWTGCFSVLPVARGKLPFALVYLRIGFRNRLTRWQCEYPIGENLEREIIPKSVENETFQPFQLLQGGETPREQGLRGSSEFHALRPYSRGDDRRLVDWKRSSRGRGMFVRTYRPDTHQRIALVLDCGRRMNVRVGDRLQIEYATDAVAQLVKLCESHEDETGLFAFHHQVLASLPCARHHRGELLKTLQTLHPGQLETDYGLFSEWLRQHRRRSLLMFVTSISSPGNLDLLSKLLGPIRRTHVPVVVAVADEQLERFAYSSVSNLEEAYVVSAAGAQIQEIEKRAKSLSASGVETIVCKAEELSFTLQRKYLELKHSGRI